MANQTKVTLPKDQAAMLEGLKASRKVIGNRCDAFTTGMANPDKQEARNNGRRAVSAENDGKALDRVIERVESGFYVG